MIFAVPARPSAEIGVVEAPRCGTVRICCLRTGLWKLSRGLRACSRSRAVAGLIPAWSAAALLDRNCNFYVQT